MLQHVPSRRQDEGCARFIAVLFFRIRTSFTPCDQDILCSHDLTGERSSLTMCVPARGCNSSDY